MPETEVHEKYTAPLPIKILLKLNMNFANKDTKKH